MEKVTKKLYPTKIMERVEKKLYPTKVMGSQKKVVTNKSYGKGYKNIIPYKSYGKSSKKLHPTKLMENRNTLQKLWKKLQKMYTQQQLDLAKNIINSGIIRHGRI